MSLLASLATAVYNLFDNETTNKENARLHNYTVSAVIPVFNEITSLKDTVIHVLNQDYPNLRDIYLLDDRSTDGTTELCREIALNWEQERTIYHVLAPENRGKAANISALLRNPNYSLSDILWFIDSDIRAHPHQVSALVDYFDTEKVAAVTGRCWPMDPVEDKNLIKDSLMDLVNEFGHQIRTGKFDRRKLADEWEEYTSIMQPHLIYQARTRAYNVTAFNRMWQMRRHAVNTLVGANFAAKKDKLLQYDISYGTCTEDLELCWYLQEMGEHVKVATDVRSSSRIPSSFGNYYSQIKRWNKGKLEALWLHKKDIFKNPGLAFTTVLPSIAGSYLSAVYRYSLPVIAFYDPWLATALITFEIMESSIITGMLSPKNLFQFPAYFLQAYAMSTSYLHAGAEVTMDILRGETHKWNKSKWNRPNLMEQNNGEVYLFDKKAN